MHSYKGSGRTVAVIIFVTIVVLFLLGVGVTLAIVIPIVSQAQTAARIQVSTDHLKRIGLALHSYHDEYNCFPPALIEGEDGEAKTSWRALLLPYIAEHYRDDYHFDLAWDDPENQAIAEKYGVLYEGPNVTRAGYTPYVAVAGEDTVLTTKGRTRMADVTDGLANTICIIEDVNHPVPWDAPQDISPDELLKRFERQDFPSPGVLLLMADGSVRLAPFGHPERLDAMIHRSDGKLLMSDGTLLMRDF